MAMVLSLFVAKIHGLAVARGQGIAAMLLKRTWQMHQQLGDRIALPFRLGVGDDQSVFTRWRPRH
ncbi:hypothetical protein [Streptomyces sp. TLI_185]|uniref:hypothetical protein n=1 Tax=Streptomyces sp. TLI_185 TaxID=2485151 RepID=UPI00161F3AF0|nr:hypothetical protein [Streptomyces sp. TLI_185]